MMAHNYHPGLFVYILWFQFAIEKKEFEKFQVTDDLGAVAAPILVPLPEPEEREDFVGCKAFCDKRIGGGHLSVCKCY